MSSSCNLVNVRNRVCRRTYNGWLSSPVFSCKVNNSKLKKATLTFTNVRKFSLYQVYNDFNKKLNCDRRISILKPKGYQNSLIGFYKRTCYLEFEPTPEIGKHCQISFNLCSSQYNEKTNIITFEVVVDKFFIDGVVKPIQDIDGIYCNCNIDDAAYCSSHTKNCYYGVV